MNDALPITAPHARVGLSQKNRRSEELSTTLGRAKTLLETALGSKSPLLERLRALADRLRQEHLQLAVFGHSSAG